MQSTSEQYDDILNAIEQINEEYPVIEDHISNPSSETESWESNSDIEGILQRNVDNYGLHEARLTTMSD